ncbi:MAG: Lcl C-terminal domain-containing protein [Saccharofermentanales bacterium]
MAYILQPEDPGYDANVQHGLIVSGIDLKVGDRRTISWSKNEYAAINVPGGTSTTFGSGRENTKKIYTQNGPGDYASGLAYAYRGGDNTDWYLPSKDELNKLYINRAAIGGFSLVCYWSSSELSASHGIYQSFGASGDWFAEYKNADAHSVRAVRSF